jgi:ERF superfamily
MSTAEASETGNSIPAPKRRVGRPKKVKPANLPVVQAPPTVTEIIARLAANPSVDVGKMRELLEFQREAEAKQEFHDAMLRMELPSISRDNKIQMKGGALRFASFENVHDAVMPILRQHGFRMSFQEYPVDGLPGYVDVHCLLIRGSLAEKSVVRMPVTPASPAMNAQQAHGAAVTYASRYGLMKLLNLNSHAPGDRDTNAAVPVAKITSEQVIHARKILSEASVPDELVTKRFGVTCDTLSDLPAVDFDVFLKACAAYSVRRKKGEAK